jgi:hypothetical protein
MWVFTAQGFISAVQHRGDRNLLMVRARTGQALEELAHMTGKGISQTPTADYPYRVVVERETFRSWLANEVERIDYDNFKNAAHVMGDPRYDEALMNVWSAMYSSEHLDSRDSG